MATKNSKLSLWLLLLLFAIPFVTANWVYFNIDDLNFTTTQKGNLIRPPFNLEVDNLFDLQGQPYTDEATNKWKIIYLATSDCNDSECKQRKHELGQLHKALGKNKDRVNMFTSLPSSTDQSFALTDNNIIIVDPNGLAMMYYMPTMETQAIMKDMRTLLKNSQIG